MAGRSGSARWSGDLQTGSGEFTVGEGVWTNAYSGASRFHDVLPGFEQEAGTNPEELLAAAHAACFTMALALTLAEAVSNLRAHSRPVRPCTSDSSTAPRRFSRSTSRPTATSPDLTRRRFSSTQTKPNAAASSRARSEEWSRSTSRRTSVPGSGTLAAGSVATRLPAQELARARAWYADKLALEPSEQRPGGLLYRCAHGEFALFESSGIASGTHTQMAWEVDDLDAVVAQLRSRGVEFEEYEEPWLTTDNGIAEVAGNYPSRGGVGERAAWFRDSEGNLLAIGEALASD
jgi:organic hydroperoxide reductase OsmC/OhrA